MATKSKPKWSNVKLTNEGRSRLRSAIRQKPECCQYVKSGSEISAMNKVQLLNLAFKLGIDIMAVLEAKEYSTYGNLEEDLSPPFSGTKELDFITGLFGKTVTRKIQLQWDYTPDWAYFDSKTGKDILHSGPYIEGWGLGVRLQAVEEFSVSTVTSKSGKNEWVDQEFKEGEWIEFHDLLNFGLITPELFPAINELMETESRAQDAANREAYRLAAELNKEPA